MISSKNGFQIRKSGSSFKINNSNFLPINNDVIDNHINNTILTKINGKDPNISKPIFASQNPYTPSFIRNPDCWLNGVSNISCMSPAQLSGAYWYQRGGTLISPRHFILAKHFIFAILENGTDMRFVDDNNNVVTRTAKKIIVDPDSDIAVGILNKDVSSNIKFAKVLPRNHSTYLSQNFGKRRYVVYTNQAEKACIGSNNSVPTNGPFISVTNPINYNDNFIGSFYEIPVNGDSGNPIFLLIDNELVIVSCWQLTVGGAAYSSLFNKINYLMNQLGGGYNLTPIDLDAVYNKYK